MIHSQKADLIRWS